MAYRAHSVFPTRRKRAPLQGHHHADDRLEPVQRKSVNLLRTRWQEDGAARGATKALLTTKPRREGASSSSSRAATAASSPIPRRDIAGACADRTSACMPGTARDSVLRGTLYDIDERYHTRQGVMRDGADGRISQQPGASSDVLQCIFRRREGVSLDSVPAVSPTV